MSLRHDDLAAEARERLMMTGVMVGRRHIMRSDLAQAARTAMAAAQAIIDAIDDEVASQRRERGLDNGWNGAGDGQETQETTLGTPVDRPPMSGTHDPGLNSCTISTYEQTDGYAVTTDTETQGKHNAETP